MTYIVFSGTLNPTHFTHFTSLQLTTRCLILGVGFRGQAIRRKYSRDRMSNGCCHDN